MPTRADTSAPTEDWGRFLNLHYRLIQIFFYADESKMGTIMVIDT